MEDNPLGITLYINKDYSVRYLSNFSKHRVELDGKVWPTSEHYFQAAKFFKTDPDWADNILQAKWPSEAKTLGRARAHVIDPNWDNGVAVCHMLRVLFAKVLQNKDVYDQLMATEDVNIVERADWDAIWGDGPERNGKNLLGKLWMIVRDTLRRQGGRDESK